MKITDGVKLGIGYFISQVATSLIFVGVVAVIILIVALVR